MEDDSKIKEWIKKNYACIFKRAFKITFVVLTALMCFLLYMEYVYEPPGTSLDELLTPTTEIENNA